MSATPASSSPSEAHQAPRAVRGRLKVMLFIVSLILLGSAAFSRWTWYHFTAEPLHILWLPLTLLVLGFMPLQLSGWHLDHPLLRFTTTLAAIALGWLNFLFFGALASWLVLGIATLGHLAWSPLGIALGCFGAATLVALYGFVNAQWIRVSRHTIALPGLPDSWLGRQALIVTDVHLGNIRRNGFSHRLVKRIRALKPDLVLLSGDLFDGTRLDPAEPLTAWEDLQAPLGSYFVTGNHDEHFNRPRMFEAVRRAGLRIVENETLDLDGVKLIGIHDEEAGDKTLLRELLAQARLERGSPSILLTHQPLNLPIVEAAGVSLQVSGHTHAGQFWPWNLVVARVWGPFGYGLNRLGSLQVLTSSGVGTWGPPLRVGTRSEIVLVTFSRAEA